VYVYLAYLFSIVKVCSDFADVLDAITAFRGFGDGRPPGCLDCSLASTDEVVSSLVVLVSETRYKQPF